MRKTNQPLPLTTHLHAVELLALLGVVLALKLQHSGCEERVMREHAAGAPQTHVPDVSKVRLCRSSVPSFCRRWVISAVLVSPRDKMASMSSSVTVARRGGKKGETQ